MYKYNKNDKFQTQYMLAPHPDQQKDVIARSGCRMATTSFILWRQRPFPPGRA